MIKTLSKHGNSLALVIEKPILDLLGAGAETSFQITTDGNALVLTPIGKKAKRPTLEESMAKGNRKYANAFKKLAG